MHATQMLVKSNGEKAVIPDNPRVDVLLDDDKTVQQDCAQQHQHAHPISQNNVACHDCGASEKRHTDLVSYKDDCPVHEESASQASRSIDTDRGTHICMTCFCLQVCK